MASPKLEPQRAISPQALAWARERAQLAHADVADKLGRKSIDGATVERWERGDAQPTPAQRRKLAQMFRIPERWLFHAQPPTAFDNLGIVDFRTPERQSLDSVSLNLRSMIEHALALQAWVVDQRTRNEEAPVELVAARSDTEPPKRVADYLRRVLEVEQIRAEAADANDFFKRLRQRLEQAGVLVLRMGQVANKTAWSLDPEEFKGFTLIDEDRLAPLIFINRKDLDDVQLFTLAHELAHLVTGGSGVSKESIQEFDHDGSGIERFCDAVAEELLAPTETFDRIWGSKRGLDGRWVEEVAREFKITPLITGRRAVSLGRATQRRLHSLVQAAHERDSTAPKKPGGNPYQNYPAWYGRELVRALTSAATTDDPSSSDALELLGLSHGVSRQLRAKLSGEPEPKPLPRMHPVKLVTLHDGWQTERQ